MSFATPSQIDAALVHVLSKVLGRSADDIRADRGRYAAYDPAERALEELRFDGKTLRPRPASAMTERSEAGDGE